MRILIFAPCEKVILDKAGNPSLISILQTVTVQVPEGATIPRNAVAPKEWYVFAHWIADENEIGKSFSQKSQIILPDGSVFDPPAVISSPFKVETLDKMIVQNTISFQGFPIGLPGPLKVRIWIDDEDGKHVTDILEYPLKLNYTAIPPTTQVQA